MALVTGLVLLLSNVSALASGAQPKGERSSGQGRSSGGPVSAAQTAENESNILAKLSQSLQSDPAISERLDSIALEISENGAPTEDGRAYLIELSDKLSNPAAADVLRQIATRPVSAADPGQNDDEFLRKLSQSLQSDPEISERLESIALEISENGAPTDDDRAYLMELSDKLTNPAVADGIRQIATRPVRAAKPEELGDSEFLRTLSRNINNEEISGRLDSIAQELDDSGELSEEGREYLVDLSQRLNKEEISNGLRRIAENN